MTDEKKPKRTHRPPLSAEELEAQYAERVKRARVRDARAAVVEMSDGPDVLAAWAAVQRAFDHGGKNGTAASYLEAARDELASVLRAYGGAALLEEGE